MGKSPARCPRCGGSYYRDAEEPTCINCGYIDYGPGLLVAAETARRESHERTNIETQARIVRRENVRRSIHGLPPLPVPRMPIERPRRFFERMPLDPIPGIAHRSNHWQAQAEKIDNERIDRARRGPAVVG